MKMRIVFLAVVLLGASGAALAEQGGQGDRDSHGGYYRHVDRKDDLRVSGTTLQAPEIDSASMVAALTLLGGGLLVMCGRRARKFQP